MPLHKELAEFYRTHLPENVIEDNILKAPCPFCGEEKDHEKGRIVVYLNRRSYFAGYFRCLNRCVPGGFAPHFGRMLGLDPATVPGYDPERQPHQAPKDLPGQTLNQEIDRLHATITPEIKDYFQERGIGKSALNELKIGYNGRYLIYPYFRENDRCYAAHCLSATAEGDHFWMGDTRFAAHGLQIFNLKDIDRCEDGAIFLAEGEANLLCLRELGYPGVAVPDSADLESIDTARFEFVKTVFLVMKHSPESQAAGRAFAERLGFKTRILQWPATRNRGFDLTALAQEEPDAFKAEVTRMIKASTAYSPFRSPNREYELFRAGLAHQQSESYQAMQTGLEKFDRSMGGVHGLNVIGGPPKSGKSCLAIQLATEIAAKRMPVVYYDFENGRQKIYQRTLARLSRIEVEKFTSGNMTDDERKRFEAASESFRELIESFRVVNDRKLTPEIMRRHIDFLRHETGRDDAIVVIDSLHKLPFKDISERRTGIDGWLRELESIRDELKVAFLVISELSRQAGGRYEGDPHMGMFKESGDIEYTADNGLIFLPEWQVETSGTQEDRINSLWLVASRENSPGLISRYRLDFPYWSFQEVAPGD